MFLLNQVQFSLLHDYCFELIVIVFPTDAQQQVSRWSIINNVDDARMVMQSLMQNYVNSDIKLTGANEGLSNANERLADANKRLADANTTLGEREHVILNLLKQLQENQAVTIGPEV